MAADSAEVDSTEVVDFVVEADSAVEADVAAADAAGSKNQARDLQKLSPGAKARD
jgi:hypothetical protein